MPMRKPVCLGFRTSCLIALGVSICAFTGGAAQPRERRKSAGADSLKPYGSVIPARAQTRRGLLITHMVDDRLYFEIPRSLLQTDLLLAVNDGAWWQRMIRWERRGGRLLLRLPETMSPDDAAFAAWLATGPRPQVAPIAAALPIETLGPEGAVVVDVTRLFTAALPVIAPPGSPDEQRSFIERVDASPDNVRIEATLTVAAAQSTRLFWNLLRLPAVPMRPRVFDKRFGFRVGTRADGGGEHDLGKEEARGYIARWRLEKRDPRARVSAPVKPIVFYLDPTIPAKWRPWVKAGVEAWRPAFEAAGFKDAIVALDPPTDDPSWSLYDARHSVVFWQESPAITGRRQRGATIEWITDGRTGEILRADVKGLGVGSLNWIRPWYFAWVSPLDPRAQRLPLPDSLEGALLQFIVSHEVGHALGLQDGSYGKFAYPVDSLRSRAWVRRMGFTPSVMNYSRSNYVAQPEDSLPPSDLLQRVGPADVYSIRWGYTPIPEARTPAEELATLDAWARTQDTVPWYRFVRGFEGRDGPYTNDALDDDDPVRSAALGAKNLRRVLGFLRRATLQPTGSHADLAEYYAAVLDLWRQQQQRVVDLVGGVTVQHKAGSQAGPVYTPLPPSRQRAAMRFLDSTAFRSPLWLIDRDATRRLEPGGTVQRVLALQVPLLHALLDTRRLHRLADAEVTAPERSAVYGLSEFLTDLRRSVWIELGRPRVVIDAYRQGLQQAYLLRVAQAMSAAVSARESNAVSGSSAYVGALLRAELVTLRGEFAGAMARTTGATRAHLETSRYLVDRTLQGSKPGDGQ